jgi:hypothetical protein
MAVDVAIQSNPSEQGILNRGGFVEHPSLTYEAQQSATTLITLTAMNLVTPKAVAMLELLFNELTPGDY